MKCKECMYFSGIQCHGHGEFWGTCQLIENLIKYMEDTKKCDYVSNTYLCMLLEDTECIILKKIGLKPSFFGGK